MSKKRMSNGKFLAIVAPIATVTLALGLTLEIVASQKGLASIFDTYIGKGAAHVTQVEGSEEWDTDYYDQTYPQATVDGGNADAKANAEGVVEKIGDEGMVLLKNKEGALPIATTTGITLLGRGSVDPIYGGSGSGNVDVTTCANPKSGIEAAGFTVDADAYDFFNSNYESYDRQNIVMDDYQGSTFFIGEIPTSAYDFTVHGSNVAVVFISRCGGEGLDLSTDLKRDSQTTASQARITANPNTAAEVANYEDGQHELELSVEERNMIDFAKANYAKTVIVLNESTVMEIGDLKDDNDVDAIIWAGSPGSKGFNSLGKILSGVINPSGKTPDLYYRDFTNDPTFKNFAINGVHEYTGIDESKVPQGVADYKSHFVQYEEGIYVGYKYYETRGYIEGEDWYDANVAYPFGYGLSYTTFKKEIVNTQIHDNGVIEVEVKVSNEGEVAGKEVVQLYYTAPYTNGGIEKAYTVLADFEKTPLIGPHSSKNVTVQLKVEDMASYDYKTEGKWVLDAGDYKIQIRENSHEVANDGSNPLEFTYNVPTRRVLDKKSDDEVNVQNRFDDVSEMFKDVVTTGYALNMSRSNFATTFPTAPTADDAKADVIQIGGQALATYFEKYNPLDHNNEEDVAPTTGADKVFALSSFRGIEYNDPAYEDLLDQLTNDDYTNSSSYIVNNAYVVNAIESLGLSAGELHDGPQGWSTLMGGLNNVCAYMSEPLLAATFNKDLAEEMGVAIGEEALALKPRYNGWYGPAMNTHRSPFAGRNFEYYSEDGVLAGKIASAVVEGVGQKGLIPFIKHFACNDQETWRTAHLATWVNEQALRENYLRPFEICVKTAEMVVKHLDENGEVLETTMKATTGVMSSFNYLGATWAGGRNDLMTEVLRNEWGFRGVVSSDFNLYDYMNSDQGMRAGTDLQLTWQGFKAPFTDTASATARIAIRTAIHNLVYAIANSNAMQYVAPGGVVWYDMSPWRIWFYIGEAILFTTTVALAAWTTLRFLKKKPEVVAE